LSTIAQNISDACYLLGDFNSILYKEYRMGGDEVTYQDIRELSQFMGPWELFEMRSIGLYYSWTNKTI